MRLSDSIETFIKALLAEDEQSVELKRNELAEYFGCAPSQINYVLATRFTLDDGYVIESRRGGGGYIRIVRVMSSDHQQLMYLINERIGQSITEAEAARKVREIYRELGAEDVSFTPIVSFGANAADPHHEPDDTVLKEGDCVLFDVGCRLDGYCSDMTRTFFYRTVSPEQRQVYETVLRANLAAEAMMRPGVRFCDLDAAARNIITEAGYGPYFTHRLGHSIGMEVHEPGDVSAVNTDTAQPGRIFSCEPGIYLTDRFGVRIEDLCMITPQGVRVLNRYPKELDIINPAE